MVVVPLLLILGHSSTTRAHLAGVSELGLVEAMLATVNVLQAGSALVKARFAEVASDKQVSSSLTVNGEERYFGTTLRSRRKDLKVALRPPDGDSCSSRRVVTSEENSGNSADLA